MSESKRLSAEELCTQIEGFAQDRAPILSFAKLWRLAAGLPTEEFPAVLERLRATKSPWEGHLLEIWAARDPLSAQAWFEAQPWEVRLRLFPEWADTWAQMESAGLRRWIASRSEEERAELGKRSSGEWLMSLAQSDPAATFELARLHPQWLAPHTVLNIWAARDPVAAAAASLQLSPEKRSTAANFIMREWGKRDPEGALHWIAQLSDASQAEAARNGFVLSQASEDPARALQWIRSSFPDNEKDQHWRMVAAYGSMKDPERVAALAQQQTDAKLRRELAAEAIRFMTAGEAGVTGGLWPPAETEKRTDARQAADLWLSESSLGGEALPHLEQVATALANQHGMDAAVHFLDQIPATLGADAKDLPAWLARRSGWKGVSEAAATMPAGARRSSWLEKSVAGLLDDGEQSAAAALIQKLPPGAERNGLLGAYAGAAFPEEPDASASLLLQLPDGEAQLVSEVEKWLSREASEARQWITTTNKLSEGQREQLLSAPVATGIRK